MPSQAALPAITHLACKPCHVRKPPGRTVTSKMRAPTLGSLVRSAGRATDPTLSRFMHCNICANLTNYYRKKRHPAEHRVAVLITDICVKEPTEPLPQVRRSAFSLAGGPRLSDATTLARQFFPRFTFQIGGRSRSSRPRRRTLALRRVNRQRRPKRSSIYAQTFALSSAVTFHKRNIPLSQSALKRFAVCPPP